MTVMFELSLMVTLVYPESSEILLYPDRRDLTFALLYW